MVDINSGSLNQSTRPQSRRQEGLLGALGGPQFLAAQFFTIFATVLGVYLAGYVGFQRTLEYDALIRTRQQANLLTSLHAELKDNTQRMREFVPLLQKTQEGEGVYQDWPRLYQFIWNASPENPVLFDLPPSALSGIQTFYENANVMLNNQTARQEFGSLTSSNVYSRTVFTEEFDKLVKTAETELLPSLQQAADSANELVRDYMD
jgi:hypothetical protein